MAQPWRLLHTQVPLLRLSHIEKLFLNACWFYLDHKGVPYVSYAYNLFMTNLRISSSHLRRSVTRPHARPWPLVTFGDLQQVMARPDSDPTSWRFELRVRYLPADLHSLCEKDRDTFLFYFEQVCRVGRGMAVEDGGNSRHSGIHDPVGWCFDFRRQWRRLRYNSSNVPVVSSLTSKLLERV